MSERKEIINLLYNIADLLEFKGENPFKVNAFRNGANVIRQLGDKFDVYLKEKRLAEVKGIGKGLQSVIYEFAEKGESSELKSLLENIPETLLELFSIHGLGPKKIKLLYDQLGITSIGELEYACKENRIALLKGFGKTTQEKILAELEKRKYFAKYILLNQADKIANEIEAELSTIKSVKKISRTGELRRIREVISQIDFVVLIDKEKTFIEHFEITEKKNNQLFIKTNYQIPVSIYFTKDLETFEKTLFDSTGSREFLSKSGFEFVKLKGKSESEFFKSMKMEFVIPEMREEEYFSLKEKNRKNSDLNFSNMQGLLHFHTTFSDGRDTLDSMIHKAKELGFNYAAVCDHSKSAFYANGLNEERILEQKKLLKQFSEEKNFVVFQGIESDILTDGSLDYSNDFLKNIDFVVASVHSQFNLSETDMTKRIIKAIENPYTDLLGHPTGRLLLSRDSYKVDVKKIIDACAANDVAIEINSNPRRLDLDWRWIYYARNKGCNFSINADAHSTEDLLYTKYGISIARKGGIQQKEVINCLALNEFKKFLKRKAERNL
ncbi:DNA polymerase/3'-5' exonuclease PolX [Ignavibacterium sp.]|uniref:DNA polymerase/3'-5' exonuclease PolX n=1 Tax=Ignavibacterium sp. TaxID=2651167 RepID=UPI002204590C|nr:DNA polymerase/3'-5' exonuclease PolX [Ignavibacterium sp.]BDQ01791.1 MAG: DNA polymerase/3'-5' exonuclease PolX [Ignavibacterium sp.]